MPPRSGPVSTVGLAGGRAGGPRTGQHAGGGKGVAKAEPSPKGGTAAAGAGAPRPGGAGASTRPVDLALAGSASGTLRPAPPGTAPEVQGTGTTTHRRGSTPVSDGSALGSEGSAPGSGGAGALPGIAASAPLLPSTRPSSPPRGQAAASGRQRELAAVRRTSTPEGPAAPVGPGAGSHLATLPSDHAAAGGTPFGDAATAVLSPASSPVAPASPAAPPTPPGGSPASLPGVASQLLSVIGPLRGSATGTQSLTVLLHPEQLGEVRATVSSGNGQLVVRLAASTADGTDALRSALPSLQSGLTGGGHHAVVLLADAGGERRGSAHTGSQLAGPPTTGRGDPPHGTTTPIPHPVPATPGDRLLDVRL